MQTVVTLAGSVFEVQTMNRVNRRQTIRKLNSNEVLVLSTGEIKTVNRSNTRRDNIHSLRITLKKLRYLINANFVGNGNELFLTLTYAENMTDVKRLYDDGRKFIKRLRYKYRNVSRVEYIAVVEPQERGAWHYHILVKFPDVDFMYIPHAELERLWGHGFVFVQDVSNVDNIGAYLSAYLSNINGIKGGRLHLYPAGMNIYRCSRGIVKPKRMSENRVFLDTVLADFPPRFQSEYEFDNDGYKVQITYKQYNLFDLGVDRSKILGYTWDKLRKHLVRRLRINVARREIYGYA